MKRLTTRTSLVTVLSLFLINVEGFCASPTGGAFLKIDPSARSYALGGGVVSATGAESTGVNPANLMKMERKMEVLTSYTSLIAGVNYGHIAGSIQRSMKSNLMVDGLGFSYTKLSVTGLEGRDKQGARTMDFGSDDSQMSMSLSGNAGKVRLGLTGKVVQSKISTYKANTAFAGDVGMAYDFKALGEDFGVGASLNNFGQDIRYINQKDALPTTLNLGVKTAVGPMSLMGGLRQALNGGTDITLGMEINLGAVSLRAGMNGASGKSEGVAGNLDGLSSGVGLKLGMAKVDYAIGQSSSDLGFSHRMSLTLQFGKKIR